MLCHLTSAVPIRDENKKRVWQSINIAERVIDVDDLSNKDIAIASAFFDLGLAFGQSLIHPHKLDQEQLDRNNQLEINAKGGKNSVYAEHDEIITKFVKEHIANKRCYKITLNLIEEAIQKRPSETSLREWINKTKRGLPVF